MQHLFCFSMNFFLRLPKRTATPRPSPRLTKSRQASLRVAGRWRIAVACAWVRCVEGFRTRFPLKSFELKGECLPYCRCKATDRLLVDSMLRELK
jgi:hypothetical protein